MTQSKKLGPSPKTPTPHRQRRMPSKRTTKHELVQLYLQIIQSSERTIHQELLRFVDHTSKPPFWNAHLVLVQAKRLQHFFFRAVACGEKRCVCRGKYKKTPHPYRFNKLSNRSYKKNAPRSINSCCVGTRTSSVFGALCLVLANAAHADWYVETRTFERFRFPMLSA